MPKSYYNIVKKFFFFRQTEWCIFHKFPDFSWSRCVKRVFYSAFVWKCTYMCKHRLGVQLFQNPPLCSSTCDLSCLTVNMWTDVNIQGWTTCKLYAAHILVQLMCVHVCPMFMQPHALGGAMSSAHMWMFWIAINTLFEKLFARVLTSHHGCLGSITGRDMSIWLVPLV